MTEEKKKGGFWSWLGLGKKNTSAESESALDENTQSETPIDEPTQQVEIHAIETQQTQSIQENVADDEVNTADLAIDDNNQAELTPENDVIESEAEQPVTVSPEHNDFTQQTTNTAAKNPNEFSNNENLIQDNEQYSTQNEPEKENVSEIETETQEKPSEGGFFSRLLKGLLKTKQNIGAGFRHFFSGKKIDDELFEELEEQLLIVDIGVPTTNKIINNLTQHASKQQLNDAELLYQQLKQEMADILKPVEQPLQIDSSKKPYVILMVGVNGVGKTTTIGKMARQFQAQGKSVMLAAGDTFRAAAVEQLQIWGERNHIPVIAQSTGSDSASVIYDAMQSAAARNIDILIADTAGRLQNKNNLMDELKKIVRVMKKYDESAPHEIMLTLDAGTGQNAISQAKLFNDAVGLTSISLTKLDGTAKGGVIFAIADQFQLPIRYIGVGEKIDDLRPFHAEEFIDALFAQEDH